jgi:hypothetical protein
LVEEIKVLGTYLDALYLSAYGEPDEDRYGSLSELKAQLHSDEERYRSLWRRLDRDLETQVLSKDGEPLSDEELALLDRSRRESFDRVEVGEIAGVPGGALYLHAKGAGKYQFVLRNNDLYVELTSWANLPSLRIEFLAHALYRYTFSELQEIASSVARHFLRFTEKVKVSRADVAVDFQPGEGWTLPDPASIVTFARRRVVHYEGDEATSLLVGERRGGLQVAIYNKGLETLTSGKEWMASVWAESCPGYDPELPVWRMEVRMYRRFMGLMEDVRGHGIETIADLEMSLGDVVSAVFEPSGSSKRRSEGWFRVVEPGGDSNLARRPVAGWFGRVVSRMGEGLERVGRARRRVAKCRVSLHKIHDRIYKAVASAAAVSRASGGYSGVSFEEFLRSLAWSVPRSRDTSSWEDDVLKRMGEYLLSPVGSAA